MQIHQGQIHADQIGTASRMDEAEGLRRPAQVSPSEAMREALRTREIQRVLDRMQQRLGAPDPGRAPDGAA